MKENNKGYTLVELLAVMVVLGLIMIVTVPNIVGIAEQNKKTSYAEDALKFKNTTEYKIRGDDTIEKPKVNGDCILMNLKYIHGNEFDTAPNGGEYLGDYSWVLMTKKDNTYVYFVQLVEEFKDSVESDLYHYRGFGFVPSTDLEGDGYLSHYKEQEKSEFYKIDVAQYRSDPDSFSSLSAFACTNLLEIYYAE